jgi:hypothetical protein
VQGEHVIDREVEEADRERTPVGHERLAALPLDRGDQGEQEGDDHQQEGGVERRQVVLAVHMEEVGHQGRRTKLSVTRSTVRAPSRART